MKESITFRTSHKEEAERIIADKIAKGGDRKLCINRLCDDLLQKWVEGEKGGLGLITSTENGTLPV